jgi:hypothetical protein
MILLFYIRSCYLYKLWCVPVLGAPIQMKGIGKIVKYPKMTFTFKDRPCLPPVFLRSSAGCTCHIRVNPIKFNSNYRALYEHNMTFIIIQTWLDSLMIHPSENAVVSISANEWLCIVIVKETVPRKRVAESISRSRAWMAELKFWQRKKCRAELLPSISLYKKAKHSIVLAHKVYLYSLIYWCYVFALCVCLGNDRFRFQG